jgi:nucleoside 2-deoxyribosyltransferase
MSKVVYLAGNNAGASTAEIFSWRDLATKALNDAGIDTASPLRGKTWLRDNYATVPDGDITERMQLLDVPEIDVLLTATPQAIYARDMADVRACDAVLTCIDYHGFGTPYELGVAAVLGKPIVLVTQNPAIANHPFVKGSAMIVVPNLGYGVTAIIGLLGPFNV